MNEEPEYICDNVGITETEIFEFADLKTPKLLNDGQRREIVEVHLAKYGGNEAEITEFMNKHFEICNDCRNLYQSELDLSEKIRISRDVK